MTDEKRKALFITHDTGNYGASRSLQLLLSNYRSVSVDMIVQRKFRGRHNHDDLRQRFGGCANRIWEAFLPFDTCYDGGRKNIIFGVLLKLYNKVFWGRDKKRIKNAISGGGYDFIHLNSLVLYPMLTERYPFVLHVREIYDGSNPKAIDYVKKAAGVIFIDEATRAPFRDVPLRKNAVLNNPFDMTPVATYADYRSERADLDVEKHTIFSMIGVASEKKGTEFIIRCFMKFKDENARLLLVGGREKATLEKCRMLARNDRRIIFWGEEPNIMKLYAFSDYILRGEELSCIGRTVYEGLYAGCGVIIPGGDRDHPAQMFEFDAFRGSIFFYTPRNEPKLLTLFQRLSGAKIRTRRLRSNVVEYVRSFHEFVTSLATG